MNKLKQKDKNEVEKLQLIYNLCVYLKKSKHVYTSKTKTRSDVAGSCKKLYKQKGTGRARSGTAKSPLRRGGGKAFGAVIRSPKYKMNKSDIKKSLKMLFQIKKDQIKTIDLKSDSVSKMTKHVILEYNIEKGSSYYYIYNNQPNKSILNIKNVTQSALYDLNVLKFLKAKNVLIEKSVENFIKEYNNV